MYLYRYIDIDIDILERLKNIVATSMMQLVILSSKGLVDEEASVNRYVYICIDIDIYIHTYIYIYIYHIYIHIHHRRRNINDAAGTAVQQGTCR